MLNLKDMTLLRTSAMIDGRWDDAAKKIHPLCIGTGHITKRKATNPGELSDKNEEMRTTIVDPRHFCKNRVAFAISALPSDNQITR